ncbi:hypothetical protein EXIGLDRAFT_777131 [Exidia glandulosa HHB12029]|uniref:Uncharacterized protein n=1 Tax=Exidia glandulosa HHB12029 TaxID=1314781 RepID=A0A165D6D6_EXIGL|nr:hypothetical protein EXIGLDRAFT_777131 [Exidia glandulosa HHB12029]
MSSGHDDEDFAVEPASYHEEGGYNESSTETSEQHLASDTLIVIIANPYNNSASYPQQDPEADSLLNAEDIKMLKEIEQSTLILGIAIGFCAVLAVSIIAFMLYRRYRRRAMDRGRPRPLPPPRVGAPAPSSGAIKGRDTRLPQTPTVVTGDINPENARVWEALVALRNEIREMREGDTAEALPQYEPQE